jgi:hypothetical protein
MSKKCKIEIELSDDGWVSMFLDGEETHMLKISNEQEFVEFTEQTLSAYAWWVGEAWRPVLEEIENNSEGYETKVVIHQES